MALTDYVIMPGSDYQDICDTIRAKTGSTDVFKSGDLSLAIKNFKDIAMEDAFVTGSFFGSTYENSRVTEIGAGVFYNCTSLTSVSFPACTTISNYAFGRCTRLTSVNFPACETIDEYAFGYCKSLTSVNFPACKSISRYAFVHCSSLTSVSFPACTTISNYSFSACSSLTSINLPACTTIGFSAFQRAYNLTSLTLGASTVCILSGSNAFSSTPIGGYSASAGTYGSIYVPASLLTSYQTATNWTYFSSRFVGY